MFIFFLNQSRSVNLSSSHLSMLSLSVGEQREPRGWWSAFLNVPSNDSPYGNIQVSDGWPCWLQQRSCRTDIWIHHGRLGQNFQVGTARPVLMIFRLFLLLPVSVHPAFSSGLIPGWARSSQKSLLVQLEMVIFPDLMPFLPKQQHHNMERNSQYWLEPGKSFVGLFLTWSSDKLLREGTPHFYLWCSVPVPRIFIVLCICECCSGAGTGGWYASVFFFTNENCGCDYNEKWTLKTAKN